MVKAKRTKLPASPRLLVQLIDMISNIKVGNEASRAKDVLGRAYDPYCGSSGMLVQSAEFLRAHAEGDGAKTDISVYGEDQMADLIIAERRHLGLNVKRGYSRR